MKFEVGDLYRAVECCNEYRTEESIKKAWVIVIGINEVACKLDGRTDWNMYAIDVLQRAIDAPNRAIVEKVC